MSGAGSSGASNLFTIAVRKLRTVVGTPAIVAPSAVFGLTVVVAAVVGSGARGGYVSLVLDLIPLVEALVPLLAVAFCYRAVLLDRESDEFDVLRMFDVSRPAYVDGVCLDQGLALMFVVFGLLLVAGATVPVLSSPDPTLLALNEAVDSPVVFLRFPVLAALLASAVTAVVLAVSAAARAARQAIAFAVGLLVAFVVGVDAATVAGLASGNFGTDAVPLVLAVSLNGAFRPLVLGVAVETGGSGSSAVALVGLIGWVVVALVVAVLTT